MRESVFRRGIGDPLSVLSSARLLDLNFTLFSLILMMVVRQDRLKITQAF